MRTIIQIVGWWTLLSCTIGPLLTWVFFWGDRTQRDGVERRSGDASKMPVGNLGRLETHVIEW